MNENLVNGRAAALVFGGIVLTSIFAWWMSLPPYALPADAPEAEFSAHRAFEHVKAMGKEPHPVGSPANDAVADYIVAQLEAMGVEHVYDQPITRRGNQNLVEQVDAILARVPGTASTGALAIDAHYDSTPYGPAAADDISGCAAMLETIRALKAGPPMQNDTFFCFADKEEHGGIGGPAVFFAHEWFKDVRAVLGLETRGTSGPGLMFETGPENGFLIRQMTEAGVSPRATSIMFDIYDRMPFGSNFSAYKRQGLPGLNVAYIDDFAYYHTMLDDPDHMNLDSLQHHGAYTLGMAKQLGNVSMENPRAPNATYFNTIGSHMVVYPRSWGWPLAILALSVFAVVLFYGLARRSITVGGMLASIGIYALATVVTFAIAMLVSYIVYNVFQERALYRNNMFSLATVLYGTGILLLVARLVHGRIRVQSLLAGALILWAINLVLIQVLLPGGAYTAVWPLLLMSFGLLALVRAPDSDQPEKKRLLIAAASAFPVVCMLAPTFVILSYTLTALAMPFAMILILLLLMVFLPQLAFLRSRQLRRGGIGFVAAGFGLLLIAMVSNTPSADRPILNCLSYAVNYDTGEVFYISREEELDEWTRNFFDDDTPRVSLAEYFGREDGYSYLKAPAPGPVFGKLKLDVLRDEVVDGRRKLRLHLDSEINAQEIHLQLEPGVEVFKATVLGIELDPSKSGWRARIETIPYEGGIIELEVEADRPVVIKTREKGYQLPEIEDFPPRPDWMITQSNRVLFRDRAIQSNHTYAIGTHEI